MTENIIQAIRERLKETAPQLTEDQIERRKRILNSDNPDFFGYGHKVGDLEKLMRDVDNKIDGTYNDALRVFKELLGSNIHEEKFCGFLYLNRFKRNFDEQVVKTFKEALDNHCDCWAICDSSIIKVLGPHLGKKNNLKLAKITIEEWSNSRNLWIKRAALVIMLKITMIRKSFNEKEVFSLVEKMLPSSEDYIQKGVGWLLKTCSRYDPDAIIEYLNKHKDELPRLILRYASEKLPKETRAKILDKRTR